MEGEPPTNTLLLLSHVALNIPEFEVRAKTRLLSGKKDANLNIEFSEFSLASLETLCTGNVAWDPNICSLFLFFLDIAYLNMQDECINVGTC